MRIFLLLLFCTLVLSLALPQANPLEEEIEEPNEIEEPEDEVPDPADEVDDGDEPPELIGDLKTSISTPIGQSISNILLGTESAQYSTLGVAPNPLTVAACAKSKDKCCIWYAISKDLTRDYRGPTGRCNALARMAIRLGFHDAGTWSKSLAAQGKDFGGADGSLVLFNEIKRAENRGLELVVLQAKLYKAKYGVGMADLIQYMANHAVVTCPLGPRVRSFIGRKDATKAAPDGLLPSVKAPADQLIALFRDKTISPHELTALIGAHSTSQQFTQDVKRFGQPQDTTPGVWDVSYYNETIQPVVPKKTFRFASDEVLSKDPRCKGEWDSFIGDQKHWNEDYAKAYVRLSLLGVNNINGLTECSQTLPAARPTFKGSTEGFIIE